MGHQPTCPVPNQFFGGQPSHALHKPSLNLTQIYGRIERIPDIMEDINAIDNIFARPLTQTQSSAISTSAQHWPPPFHLDQTPKTQP